MSLKEFITSQASMKLIYYYEEYVIKHLFLGRSGSAKALVEYGESDEYNLHLTYLIETWISNMEDQFYISMKDGKNLDWYYCLNTNEFNHFVRDFADDTNNKFTEWEKNYDGTFEYINKCYEDGCCFPEFNDEWIYDIFERKILDVVLK
jgi:hypothetical protein